MRSRDEVYAELFGEPRTVAPDAEDAVPAVELRRYTVAHGEAYIDLWVSSGMSDRAMRDEDGEPLRRELIFYAEPGPFDYQHGLHVVARLPFENETFVDFGHTVQLLGHFFVPGGADLLFAEDAAPVALPSILLVEPLVSAHQELAEMLEIEGDAVEFLWVVPISEAEHELVDHKGVDALLDLFDEREHPWVFPTGGRESYL